ncbi:hypothetical protein DRZ77_02245 [Candidatus Woesearchaeota archaeon]|nr:MAG: hypothetical protein DRZ77_02245 [Candidatus Woesearchaeota archaeon]
MPSLRFIKLANVFEQLERTTSGNKMREILARFFKTVPKKEIDIIAYLLLGQIASKYEDINIGMAEKMVLRSIAIDSGRAEKEVSSTFKKLGDVGLTAEKLTTKSKPTLTVAQVFNTLHKIAAASGPGSQEFKIKTLAALLKKASPKEARYIARIILGTLRLGAGDMTLLDALAIAFTGTKANKPKLEHAYNICPDIGIIAKTIAIKGLKGIEKIGVTVGRPIQMMLAQRAKSVQMIKEKIPGVIACEEKYDGERVQAHFDGKRIILFSRRLENTTNQFPDVVEGLKKSIKAKSYVIEGEVVPIDEKGNLLPFQILMQRRRKYDVELYVKKIPVCLFLFDLLFLNGKSYIHKPYPERHKALQKIIKPTKRIKLANRKLCKEIDCIEDFFNWCISHGAEGIIAKSCAPDSTYKAGVRGWLWIKWKQEYQKLADTFDLVVVGAFYGKGKRAGTYGALLCAAYNHKLDRFETFCKLGSGFTDKQLAELPKKFAKYKIPHKPARLLVHKDMKPDVWFTPAVVVEVLGAEITRSPLHTCAVEKGQGLALRFPRFVRYRADKSPEQATTVKEILDMYKERK